MNFRKLYPYVFYLLIFMCGVVAANNLQGLVEVNQNYNPAWWRVYLAVFFAIFSAKSVNNLGT